MLKNEILRVYNEGGYGNNHTTLLDTCNLVMVFDCGFQWYDVIMLIGYWNYVPKYSWLSLNEALLDSEDDEIIRVRKHGSLKDCIEAMNEDKYIRDRIEEGYEIEFINKAYAKELMEAIK